MDWDFAIERNREALKHVLAMLVAMVGLAGLSVAICEGRRRDEARSNNGCARPTLPRHLHRAVLRLLRPAESAARRLVIVAARGLVITLPRSRSRESKPTQPAVRPGVGTGILMPPGVRPQPSRPPLPARKCALPLFDPTRRQRGQEKRTGASGVPRISLPGVGKPFPVPPERQSKGGRPLAPDDPIDAVRLTLRLEALASALDDLPRQARRFARWRMRRDVAGAQARDRDAVGAQAKRHDAAGAQTRNHGAAGVREAQVSSPTRIRRLWPLRLGCPPGSTSRPTHAVHAILSDTHALAWEVLENRDTS